MDIIIFALISGFLFYKLYNVLGSGGIDMFKSDKSSVIDVTPNRVEPTNIENKTNWLSEIKQIKKYDDNFLETNFIKGAIRAYEMILEAYNKSDDETLNYLTSPDIYQLIKGDLAKNKENNERIEKIIIALDNPIIDNIEIDEDIANISTIFKGEQMITTTNSIDTSSNSRRIKFTDKWIFQKNLSSKNPNWQLVEIRKM